MLEFKYDMKITVVSFIWLKYLSLKISNFCLLYLIVYTV